jgi:hypothetical protein
MRTVWCSRHGQQKVAAAKTIINIQRNEGMNRRVKCILFLGHRTSAESSTSCRILGNLSVISVSQHLSLSYHSHYCDFVLNVSIQFTPPVSQSSKGSERIRQSNMQIKRTRCAYMTALFVLYISLNLVLRKAERSGVQIPDCARDFLFPRTVQTSSGTH